MPDIVALTLDKVSDGSDASFWDTGTFQPSPNRTVLLFCQGLGSLPPPAVVIPTVVGNGLPWTLVASQLYDFANVDRGRLSVFRGLSASPTLGTTRVSYNRTHFRHAITVIEFTNTDIGNLGANAIVGTPAQAKIAAGSGLTPSVSMPVGENADNSNIGMLASEDPDPGGSPGLGFIILESNPGVEQGGGHFIEMSQVVLTTVDFQVSADPEFGMIGIELRNATPAAGPGEPQIIGRPSFISGNLITP